MRDVFHEGKSMVGLSSVFKEMGEKMKDLDAVAMYQDSHDFNRSLYLLNDWRAQMAQTALVLTARGIPIVYYGGEQGLKGKDDDQSRELMFESFDRQAPMYKFI